jgi:hypothetical protein
MFEISSYSFTDNKGGGINGYAHIINNDVETCYTYNMSTPTTNDDITDYLRQAYEAGELVQYKVVGHIDRSGSEPIFVFNRDEIESD